MTNYNLLMIQNPVLRWGWRSC